MIASRTRKTAAMGAKGNFLVAKSYGIPKMIRVWVLDRFDEMNFHDVQQDHARRPRETLRAWGGGTTHDHGYLDGTKSRSYYRDDGEDYKYVPKEPHTRYDCTKNYNGFPKESNTSYDNAKKYRSVPGKFHSYHDDTKNFDNVRRESHTYYGNAEGYNNAPDDYRVMQFSAQYRRGPGISSIGMALPGFVAPQQLGGNSEMSQMTCKS